MTTFNSVVKTILERNGLHSHIPCIPGIPWSSQFWKEMDSIPTYLAFQGFLGLIILGIQPFQFRLHKEFYANPAHKVIEKSIGMFVAERKAAILRDKGVSLKANVVVTKMIDKGVTSFQKLCSFCMP
ncbi:hypothetical protein L2E82_22721 [Cichorium intybus]|uniref:Uncharacterized protein n=1 Tax=Cichorium intybus TaxID=13427 RepID=A0ACB9DYZ5_CICIN|nr:hypothetical protein L2E82_22721 [Cichorium intybus]